MYATIMLVTLPPFVTPTSIIHWHHQLHAVVRYYHRKFAVTSTIQLLTRCSTSACHPAATRCSSILVLASLARSGYRYARSFALVSCVAARSSLGQFAPRPQPRPSPSSPTSPASSPAPPLAPPSPSSPTSLAPRRISSAVVIDDRSVLRIYLFVDFVVLVVYL